MPAVTVDGLVFDFPTGWRAAKYDDWTYYQKQFQQVCGGAKAVDLAVLAANNCLWLVEVKDYRRNPRTKPSALADEFAEKVRDTLAGLAAGRVRASEAERQFARDALAAADVRLVLHVEQPAAHSKLFPRAIDTAKVLQRLKQLVKAIDPRVKVAECRNMLNLVWNVSPE